MGKASLESDPKFDLENRLLEYSARIIRLADSLPNTRAATHVANQILRSGTSPLPNHGEAQAAESVDDFIHKIRICLKELRETRRWLRLIVCVPLVKETERITPLIDETIELIRIFAASVRTANTRKAGKRQPASGKS
jgi:four helix bundle protein